MKHNSSNLFPEHLLVLSSVTIMFFTSTILSIIISFDPYNTPGSYLSLF